MSAEAGEARLYGVLKPPPVQMALLRLPVEPRVSLDEALAALSAEPRPAASQSSDTLLRGQALLELSMDAGGERWLLIYAVDDVAKRVTVLAVERRLV